jgi:hypothetical protein
LIRIFSVTLEQVVQRDGDQVMWEFGVNLHQTSIANKHTPDRLFESIPIISRVIVSAIASRGDKTGEKEP